MLMIECGVDIGLLNNFKQLPVLNYFLEPNGIFKLSILNINLNTLGLLLQHTPDINTITHNGKALIHYAIQIRMYADLEQFILTMWSIILSHHPDLNIVDSEGMHVLDNLPTDSKLYALLVQRGATPLIIPEVIQLTEETKRLEHSTQRLCRQLQAESSFRPKVTIIKNLINEIKSSARYIQLTETVTQQLQSAVFKEQFIIHALNELERINDKYPQNHYIFFNRQQLAANGKTIVYVYQKPDIAGIFRALQLLANNRRKWGWELLSTRLASELKNKPCEVLENQSFTLQCYDFTGSDIPLLVHATNAEPTTLRQTLNSEQSFFNDMLYVSCSLIDDSAVGFPMMGHDQAPFRLYLIMDIDPNAIAVYSTINISSPHSLAHLFDQMFTYYKNTLKRNVLDSYIQQRLYEDHNISLLEDVTHVCTPTGLQQIRAQTPVGTHNEILILGEQVSRDLGANPPRMIGLAIDKSEFLNASAQPNFNETLAIMQNSHLPILLVDFKKRMELRRNTRQPLYQRLADCAATCVKSREALVHSYYQLNRLGIRQNPQLTSQFFQNRQRVEEEDNHLRELMEECAPANKRR